MAKPETKIIEQDGKTYEFTPGKYGSTVVRVSRPRPETPLYTPIEKRAKVIGPVPPPSLGATRG